MNAVHQAIRRGLGPRPRGLVLRWSDISREGCYLLLGSGGLVRIPSRRYAPAFAPAETRAATRALWAVQLSEDPAEMLSVLRARAARHGHPVCF